MAKINDMTNRVCNTLDEVKLFLKDNGILGKPVGFEFYHEGLADYVLDQEPRLSIRMSIASNVPYDRIMSMSDFFDEMYTIDYLRIGLCLEDSEDQLIIDYRSQSSLSSGDFSLLHIEDLRSNKVGPDEFISNKLTYLKAVNNDMDELVNSLKSIVESKQGDK